MYSPGRGDVKVNVDESNIMTIRAKSSYQEPGNVLLRQTNIGNYYRAFSLSNEFNKDIISAKLENGVLEVTVPRREETKPKQIEINA